MQTYNECFAVVMSPDERDELAANVVLVWSHLEDYFKNVGDVDAGTEDAKLMDAMGALEQFHRRLKNGKFA